jgi:hypothetical protein
MLKYQIMFVVNSLRLNFLQWKESITVDNNRQRRNFTGDLTGGPQITSLSFIMWVKVLIVALKLSETDTCPAFRPPTVIVFRLS